jgi:hypothetical protein
VSPTQAAISGSKATITNAGHTLDVLRVSGGGAFSTYDYRGDSDYTGGWRLDEKVTGGDNRYLHVLSVDGAAASATATGTSGVTVNLASGGTATVAFNRDTAGATLTLNGSTITLAPGVDALPN